MSEEAIKHDSTLSAMKAVLREIGVITKSRQTSGSGDFRFAFRGIEELLEVVNPLCKKHGLLTPPAMVGDPIVGEYSTKNSTMHWVMVPTAIHFQAHEGDIIVGGPFLGEAADSGDKAATKAQSVAWREIMFKTFNVPTRGEDYDTEGDEEAKAAGRAEPEEPEIDVTALGWDDLADFEKGWGDLKEMCAAPGESGEWAKAWVKGHGVTKGNVKAGFVAEMFVTMAGAKKDGDWKANFTPPEIPGGEPF